MSIYFDTVQVLLANDVGDKLTISMGARCNHKHGRGNLHLTLSLLKAREHSCEHFIECFFRHVNRYSHAVKLRQFAPFTVFVKASVFVPLYTRRSSLMK